ncbi:MAG: hypothetical protein ABIE68_03200 [bacterium]
MEKSKKPTKKIGNLETEPEFVRQLFITFFITSSIWFFISLGKFIFTPRFDSSGYILTLVLFLLSLAMILILLFPKIRNSFIYSLMVASFAFLLIFSGNQILQKSEAVCQTIKNSEWQQEYYSLAGQALQKETKEKLAECL